MLRYPGQTHDGLSSNTRASSMLAARAILIVLLVIVGSRQAEQVTSRKNSPLLSLTTVAVSPAALDPLPEVYTEMGACSKHHSVHLAV